MLFSASSAQPFDNFSAPRVAADHMIILICALPLVPPSACFSQPRPCVSGLKLQRPDEGYRGLFISKGSLSRGHVLPVLSNEAQFRVLLAISVKDYASVMQGCEGKRARHKRGVGGLCHALFDSGTQNLHHTASLCGDTFVVSASKTWQRWRHESTTPQLSNSARF